jgi:hypothetical protein
MHERAAHPAAAQEKAFFSSFFDLRLQTQRWYTSARAPTEKWVRITSRQRHQFEVVSLVMWNSNHPTDKTIKGGSISSTLFAANVEDFVDSTNSLLRHTVDLQ